MFLEQKVYISFLLQAFLSALVFGNYILQETLETVKSGVLITFKSCM